jgi:hypothetical protein
MKRSSKTEPRAERIKKSVLEHLAESGNVSYACKRAGVSRETFYTWKAEDGVFAEDANTATEYGKSFVNDLAHTQLILNIQKGDMQAVRFQLISCHPDYKPRRPGPAEDLKPVTDIKITVVDPSKVAEAKAEIQKQREKDGAEGAEGAGD